MSNKVKKSNKKKYIISLSAAVLIVVVTAISFITFAKDNNTVTDKANENKASTNALHISQIQADPMSFTGEITLNGIMAATSDQDPTLLGIMDSKEFANCGSLSCGAYIQAVRYEGEFPKHYDEIELTGKFVELEGYPLFEATSMKVIKNHAPPGMLQ